MGNMYAAEDNDYADQRHKCLFSMSIIMNDRNKCHYI